MEYPKMKRYLAMLHTIVASSLLLFIAIQLAQAQKPAGLNRPSGVPENYVVTPFGYFHPSCVREVSSSINTTDEKTLACNYPHYTAQGKAVTAGETEAAVSQATEPTLSGWIVFSYLLNPTSPFGQLNSSWTVPAAPTTNDGQYIYLMSVLENEAAPANIMEPVLRWAEGQWTITPWNCCTSGFAQSGPSVVVSPGDTISTWIKSNSTGTNVNATWDIIMSDNTSGEMTTLKNTPAENQVFTWALGGLVAAYGVVQCSDFPPQGTSTFYDIAAFDPNFNKLSNPAWIVANYTSGESPQCNYSGQISGTNNNTATITY
jgi:hypothetical protein